MTKSRYLPGTEAKGGGRDEQQEPFEERVFSFLCSGCCGAELSPKRNEPAWKFTIHRIYERYPLYSIFGIKCHVRLFTNLILRITWGSLNLILMLLLFWTLQHFYIYITLYIAHMFPRVQVLCILSHNFHESNTILRFLKYTVKYQLNISRKQTFKWCFLKVTIESCVNKCF